MHKITAALLAALEAARTLGPKLQAYLLDLHIAAIEKLDDKADDIEFSAELAYSKGVEALENVLATAKAKAAALRDEVDAQAEKHGIAL